MPLQTIQPVLQPVRRRRRRRRRRVVWPRVALIGAVAAASGAGGIWIGARHSAAPHAAAPPRPAVRRVEVQHVVKAPRREALVTGPALLRHRFEPAISAQAAILVDATNGRVLWALHPHERRKIASTTKIMTALLALRVLQPHDVVKVDPSVPRVPLVREGLRAGERVDAWKLFYGLLLYSGNDDALALAIAAGGNRNAFVHEMNAEAHTLGLHDTHFRSPSGVEDEDNYSSAWDLAALTRVAMRNERFDTIVRTRVKRVPWSPPTYAKEYVNKNLLIGTYPGATGVKTGYTTKSGPCLVASAKRGGISLIAVVLDSPNEYGDAKRLLNLGFRSL